MDALERRVERLERTNRRLLILSVAALAASVLMGAQAATDVVRARRLEIVDERGVPLAVLAPSRSGAGGELTLRDRDGERRAALSAEAEGASINLQGGRVDDPAGTAGLHADGNGATMGLVGTRAAVSMSVRKDRPRIATTNAHGKETFAAPWK